MSQRSRLIVLTVFGLALALLLELADAGDGSWVGKKIILKRSGVQIGLMAKDGARKDVARLAYLDYVVDADQDGWLQVRERGVAGWFDKNEAVLAEQAVSFFTERIKANRRDAGAYAHRGWAWRVSGELDLALKDYDEALRLQAETAAWYDNRGVIWLEKKKYDKALKDFDEAIRRDPKNALAFNDRGWTWFRKGEDDKAIKDYNEAIRLDPDHVPAFGGRAIVWYDKAEYGSWNWGHAEFFIQNNSAWPQHARLNTLGWPEDELPLVNDQVLVVAGLESAIDALPPEESAQWLEQVVYKARAVEVVEADVSTVMAAVATGD